MIITKLQGGLGNQMFQYAIGRIISNKLNVPFKLDISYYDHDKKRIYSLDAFNIKGEIATESDINKVKGGGFLDKLFGRSKELQMFKDSYLFDPKILNSQDNTYIEGFWQNENYFKDIRDLLIEDFTLKKPIHNKIVENIKNSESVSVHMRFGDYTEEKYKKIFNSPTFEYYKTGINFINEKTPNPHFFVFSDDIIKAKQFNFPENTTFIEKIWHLSDAEELTLMSLCKHNITTNSTFSWWAAWLNQNPNKIITTPKNWSIYQVEDKDPIPKTWKKI